MNYKEITNLILLERRDQDLTQKELAQKAGIHYRSVMNLENGADTKFSTIEKILSALKLKINIYRPKDTSTI